MSGQFRLCCTECQIVLAEVVSRQGEIQKSAARHCLHFSESPDIQIVSNPCLTSCFGCFPKPWSTSKFGVEARIVGNIESLSIESIT